MTDYFIFGAVLLTGESECGEGSERYGGRVHSVGRHDQAANVKGYILEAERL